MAIPGKRGKYKKLTEKSHRQLQKDADREFSKYIRLLDSNEYGVVKCCTCGKEFFWKEVDCGHYIKRKREITRYDETNCNAQCKACNKFGKGEEVKHKEYIDKMHGEGTADKLRIKSNKIMIRKKADYIALIYHYRLLWQKLEKNKFVPKDE